MDKLVNSSHFPVKIIRIYVDTFLELQCIYPRVLKVFGMTEGVC